MHSVNYIPEEGGKFGRYFRANIEVFYPLTEPTVYLLWHI